MNIKYYKYLIFIISSSILVFIDQLTKKFATNYLMNKSQIYVIKNILSFVYTENRGAAFGIMQGKLMFFYILTIIVFIIIFYFLHRLEFNKHNLCYFITICLIFSGALGNFIDRYKNQYVVDFIYFMPIDFPVFNFADICITCGCILLIISTFTIYRKD